MTRKVVIRGGFRGGNQQIVNHLSTPNHQVKVSLPFWRQPGFKRGLAGAAMLVGGILTLFPTTALLGKALFGLGGGTYAIGVADAARRSAPEHNGDKGLWYQIITLILQLISKYKKGA